MLMEKLHLDFPDKYCSELSGGELRRVMLARSLAAEPDLLLLDEPTNHLDVEMIAWIEKFLSEYTGACLLVTHDRFFLDRVATRIVELDHGSFYSYDGSYADFLAGKEEREYNEDVLEHPHVWVVLEPSLQKHRLGLVHYLLEAISENPGIIKYTEIALL